MSYKSCWQLIICYEMTIMCCKLRPFLKAKCSRDFMLACLLLCLPCATNLLSFALCSNLYEQDLTPSAILLLVLLVLHDLLCLQTALKVSLGAFQQNKLVLPRASIFESSYCLMLWDIDDRSKLPTLTASSHTGMPICTTCYAYGASCFYVRDSPELQELS